ncbi:MAG: class I SAM-dependent methyltransferase [Phycisphaeraceae bacterium]|nr:class I SAM-dependent methyltransferase [Phycisphaeraceae bacterium]
MSSWMARARRSVFPEAPAAETATISPGGYLTPYREMVDREGPSFGALLWTSRETQAARFRAMSEMIDLDGKRVLDAGCGRGDFAAFLHARGTPCCYTGLDAIGEMVEEAESRGIPGTAYRRGDFVADPRAFDSEPGPEVIVFSGSLNTLDQDAAQAVLERAWHSCSLALAFNFLRVPSRPTRGRAGGDGYIRRFDALSMLEWAAERTPLLRYRQDYLMGQDGTIVMWVR